MQIAGNEVIFHKTHQANSSKHIPVYIAILILLLILDPEAPQKNIRINMYNSLSDPYALNG